MKLICILSEPPNINRGFKKVTAIILYQSFSQKVILDKAKMD